MKALYLYCIRSGGESSLHATGAIESSKVYGISFKDLEAVVSEIDLEKISETEITNKAKEDVKWITQEAQKHQQVLNTTMQSTSSTIIPMHFGTLFKNRKNLEKMMEEKYSNFVSLINTLKNKEEWGVKIYVHEPTYKESIKKNTLLQKQTHKVEQADIGLDYFEELELEELAENVLEKEINGKSETFYKTLQQYATDARKTKPLNREFIKAVAGGNEKDMMILNSSYLLEKKSIDSFLATLKQLKKKNKEFHFECTGPWPAYNFV
jgi:hypothetical protein